jgi:uncharacterized lipoprotein YddW (UPF0748 family)
MVGRRGNDPLGFARPIRRGAAGGTRPPEERPLGVARAPLKIPRQSAFQLRNRSLISGLMLSRRTLSVFVGSLALLSFAQAGDFRAAWVASVYNLNFPTRPGLSPDEQKDQIARIVETAKRLGLNALLVQVRPEGDALYRSDLEPWSRFLTGVQGQPPGYDPLAVFLEEGARYGVSIHAWINPYRAATDASAARA